VVFEARNDPKLLKFGKKTNIGTHKEYAYIDADVIQVIKKRIKNEKDHTLALSRIEQLMDAEPGTPEFDELALPSTLVEIYEDEHFPIEMPDPVTAIKFRMQQLGLK